MSLINLKYIFCNCKFFEFYENLYEKQKNYEQKIFLVFIKKFYKIQIKIFFLK